MAKIAEAFVDIKARTDKLRQGLRGAVQQTRKSTERMSAAISRFKGVAIAAFALLGAKLTKDSAKAWIAYEDQLVKVSAALSVTGQEVEKNTAFLREQATIIQRNTRISDNQILQLQELAIGLGASAEQANELAKATIGLSIKLGKDASPEMLRYVRLAQQGEFTMLRRYIPALRAATTEAEQFAIVQKFTNEGFAAAQKQTKSAGGQLDQMKNSFGDLQKAVGRTFTDSGFFTAIRVAIEQLTQSVTMLGDAFGRIRGKVKEGFNVLGILGPGVGNVGDAITTELEAQFTVLLARITGASDASPRDARRLIEMRKEAARLQGEINLRNEAKKPDATLAKGFVAAIQTATGTFKTGRPTELAELMKELIKVQRREMVVAQEQTTDAVLQIGFA